MDISIVIPAFNESNKIQRDVDTAAAFFNDYNLRGQIIVVDDGSSDNTAKKAEQTAIPENIGLKVIRLPIHQGKGKAVRKGIEQTSGEYVLFADSGCCVPYQNALKGLELLKTRQCDIAHGSRKLPDSIIKKPGSFTRRIYSLLFKRFAISVMKTPAHLTDTQCGFKIYRGDTARKLYSQSFCDGFMLDIEIILRAKKQKYSIKEFPVEWTWDPDSRLKPLKSILGILCELLEIKRKI